MRDIFGAWSKSFNVKQRKHVLLGVAALCWALWLSWNNSIFQGSKPFSCLQAIIKSAFWIRSWSIHTMVLVVWKSLSGDDRIRNLQQVWVEFFEEDY
jgi:hypothetical protein